MIRYIERKQLDAKKYDVCVENSLQHKIYAYSWYLDIVADNWGILIYGDYQCVMPLPWRSKFGIHYVYPPEWTQQLGVFSSNKIDDKLLEIFIKSIPNKFKKQTINFNFGNFHKKFEVKVNYNLSLNKSYNEIIKGYSKLRKRHLKNTDIQPFSLNNSDNSRDLIELFTSQKKDTIQIIPSSYTKLESLILHLIEQKKVAIIKAIDQNSGLLGGAIFLIENHKIYYLFSSVSKKGAEMNVMTTIIDSVINKYSETDYVLDFEGSMVPGIARFFKSFGAIKEEYYSLKKYVVF